MSSERPRAAAGGGRGISVVPMVIFTALAVLLGVLVLRDSFDNKSKGSSSSNGATTSKTTTTKKDAASDTTTTTEVVDKTATVVVANASGKKGAAASMTAELKKQGFTLADPTNRKPSASNASVTKVYYDPTGGEATAKAVAKLLGNVVSEPLPKTIPTETGTLGGAKVLVFLGLDWANKTIGAAGTPVETTTPGQLAPGEQDTDPPTTKPGGKTATTKTATTKKK